MGLSPEVERDFIKKDLGPALAANGYKDIKLMMLDDQRLFLPVWVNTILSDPEAKKFVSGMCNDLSQNFLYGGIAFKIIPYYLIRKTRFFNNRLQAV